MCLLQVSSLCSGFISGIIVILIQLSFFVVYKSIVHLMIDHLLFLMFDNDCYARCPKALISRSNSKTSRVFTVAQPMEKLFLTNTEYFELPKVMRHELDANLLDKAEYLMTQNGHHAALNIIESAIASIDPDINLRNISCAPLVNVKALARAFRLQGNIKEASIDYQVVSDEMCEALACHEMVIIVYDIYIYIYMKIMTYIFIFYHHRAYYTGTSYTRDVQRNLLIVPQSLFNIYWLLIYFQ